MNAETIMNARAAKQEIQNPQLRWVDELLCVMNRRGWLATLVALMILGFSSAAVYFAPMVKEVLIEERDAAKARQEEAKANKLAADEGRVEMKSMREEYAKHEAEHIQATLQMAAKQDRTNQLLEDAQRTMAPAVESRQRSEKVQEGILKLLEKHPKIDEGSDLFHDRRSIGGETKNARQVDQVWRDSGATQ